MKTHFLFDSGEWQGSGTVSFSISPDVLDFEAKWTIAKQLNSFRSVQAVQVFELDPITNIFTIQIVDDDHFDITLENNLLGTHRGTGIIDEDLVAWEFRHPGQFEGFEVYERISDNEYQMRAEYLSEDNARTMIRGKIWRKTQQDDTSCFS